jgi:putative oxidoreductase
MATRASFNVAARWLMALFFIASGTAKVFAFQAAAAIMTTVGFPFPQFSLVGINLLEIGGGLALLFGIRTRQVSVVLISFLILATIMFHARFISDPVAGPDQFVHMIKNIAIIGGLLILAADGNGTRVPDATTAS